MSENHSEFVQGQIEGLRHICALLAQRVFTSPAALADFAALLGQFEHDSWEGRDTSFLEGVTDSLGRNVASPPW